MRPEVTPLGLKDSHFDMDMNQLCKKLLPRYGSFDTSSKMLDIGGRANDDSYYKGECQFWNMDYHILNIVGKAHPKFFKADITNCPEIPNNSFDFIYSSDVRSNDDYNGSINTFNISILKDINIVYLHTSYKDLFFDLTKKIGFNHPPGSFLIIGWLSKSILFFFKYFVKFFSFSIILMHLIIFHCIVWEQH